MAAEAQRRGFYNADRKVFQGDGDQKNWTVQKVHFPDLTAVTDFVHPVSYVFDAGQAVTNSLAAQWEQYLDWMTACWRGDVRKVLDELRSWQDRLGSPTSPPAEGTDPREILRQTITYLDHNADRMDYPTYRKQGLPITSCLVESVIKQINWRVKGAEKFWNRPEGAEVILQLRAAALSDGDMLGQFVLSRPSSVYYRRGPASPPLDPK